MERKRKKRKLYVDMCKDLLKKVGIDPTFENVHVYIQKEFLFLKNGTDNKDYLILSDGSNKAIYNVDDDVYTDTENIEHLF